MEAKGASAEIASGATLGRSAASEALLFCIDTQRLHGLSIRPDASSAWWCGTKAITINAHAKNRKTDTPKVSVEAAASDGDDYNTTIEIPRFS